MNQMNTPRLLAVATAAVLWVAIGATPAAAQEDARWLPLTGCWQPLAPIAEDGSEAPETELLCVTTNAQGGVDMNSYEGTELLGTVTMFADGQSRSVEREGCTGSESAQFAEDRRFITVQNDYTCEGELEGRTAGLIAMVTPYEWINVQVFDADGEDAAGVMRYTRADDQVVEAAGITVDGDRALAVSRARMAVARELTVGDIIAASTVVHPKALEAWVVEQGDLMPVDADDLMRMAKANVPESVIDMAVATSHPTRFAIQQGQQVEGRSDRYDRRRRRLGFFPGSFGYLGWTRHGGYGYGYGFSPYAYSSLYGYGYGYGGYGYGNYYGSYGYRPVIVVPNNTRNNGGRAINGRGYSRGSNAGGSVGRPATRRDTGSAVSSGGRSSGGAAASSRGTSTRRSGSARKAKRRGGGSDLF